MSRVPIIRQVAWLAVLLQLLILAAFIAIAAVVSGGYGDNAFLAGAVAYVVLSFALRHTVTRRHRRGVRLMRAQRFEEAIPHFESSAAFFERRPWVDRFRAVTLLSASAMSYREMALCNVAFGLTQIGRGAAARAAYERVLEEYPDNGIARTSLRIIESAQLGDAPLQARS